MTIFTNNAILRPGNSALQFTYHDEPDGSVNETISPSFLMSLLFIVSYPAFAAGPSANVRAIVSGIVTYTRWPELSAPPRLCIFSTSRYTQSLTQQSPEALPYQPVVVHSTEEALNTVCDGFYFGSESPSQQSEFTSKYRPRPLLLIAEQNTECAIGSAFA